MIIIDVTDVTGGYQYWFNFAQQKGKFFECDEAIQQWPGLVKAFLEDGIQFDGVYGMRMCKKLIFFLFLSLFQFLIVSVHFKSDSWNETKNPISWI